MRAARQNLFSTRFHISSADKPIKKKLNSKKSRNDLGESKYNSARDASTMIVKYAGKSRLTRLSIYEPNGR